MKRFFAVLASASFVLAIGCSDYDIRLEKTLEERRYEKRLNANLEPAPTKGMLQADDIFIRPPKGLAGRLRLLPLPSSSPENLTSRIASSTRRTVRACTSLARIKKPKGAPNAKKAAAPAEHRPPEASSLTTSSSWSRPPTTSSSRPRSSSPNRIPRRPGERRTKPEAGLGLKQVEVYVYTEPNGVHEVALIFEYPNAQEKEKDKTAYMSPKIGRCLECFAVSERAKSVLSGAA